MVKKIVFQYWPQLLISLAILAFFSRLFFPPSIFINPDYGRSDLMHSKIPTQLIMAKSLKNLALPLWEPKIGQGFPVFDEGEMGFLFLPNLVLFSVFPFWLAFNLNYPLIFLTAAFGAYFLSRSFKLGKTASTICALTFAFSPIFTLHIHHLNLIQAASIVPWLFWEVNSFAKSKKLIYLFLLAFSLSQQYFAGFPQYVAYTLPFLLIFFLAQTFPKIKSKLQKTKLFALFTITIVLGTLISSVQIESSFRLVQLSSKFASNPQDILTQFPYVPKNLLTIFNPYILGNPKNATYPRWEPGQWGIFWENSSYFGILQLVLVSAFLTSKLYKRKNPKTNFEILLLCSLGGLGLLLSLGNHAPFHPIFSIPPYSIFRVPSRFLLISFLSVAVLTAFAVEYFPKPKNKIKPALLAIFALAVIIFDSFFNWWPYQLTARQEEIFNPPPITRKITQQGRVVSFGEETTWNQIFLDTGWPSSNEKDKYLFFKNFLGQNLNLLYGQPQLYQYESIVPRRIQNIETLSKLEAKVTSNALEIGPISQKILDMSSVAYATTPQPITSSLWEQIDKQENGNQAIYLYRNLNFIPQVFLVGDYKTAASIQDVFDILKSQEFDPKKTVILEEEIPFIPNVQSKENRVEITNYQNSRVSISAQLKTPSILVLSDTYDPAWKAKIDSKPTQIFPANINSRALVIPQGNHQIEFFYHREDIKIFGLLSLGSFLVAVLLCFKFYKTKISQSG